MKWFGGIEAGGTKFNCIIANDPAQVLDEIRIATTTPEETLPKVISFFTRTIYEKGIELQSIGIGAFGPVDLDSSSKTYGSITSTPKLAWRDTRLLSMLETKLNLPLAFDTDVNVAARGEGKWGAAQDLENYVYITVGTGIGGGAFVNGNPVHGLIHPEMGHMFVPHNLSFDPFPGICPSHGDCIEGLASGPALLTRWGISAETLPLDHPAWDLEADYLAHLLANIVMTLSPERIIMGGGVMKVPGLLEKSRKALLKILNGYVESEKILSDIENYIQRPGLGDRAGVLGSIALAQTIST